MCPGQHLGTTAGLGEAGRIKTPVVCVRPTLELQIGIKHDRILCSQHLFKFLLGYMCFLWRLSQITTTLVASHRRKLLCHISGGQESELQVSAGLGGVRGAICPMPLPELLVDASVLGSPWLGYTSLQCLHGVRRSSSPRPVSISPPCFFFPFFLVTGFGAHPNPG